jgi:hypothetical protein
VCNEVADSPRRIILFIDDIHNLVPNQQNVGAAGCARAAALRCAVRAPRQRRGLFFVCVCTRLPCFPRQCLL